MRDQDDTRHWEAWAEAGHAGCGSWHRDPDGPVVCACGMTIIPVTAKHVTDSQPYPARNAIALAVADALGAERVVAGAQVLRYNLGDVRHEVTFTPDVQYMLALIADGETAEPFSFAIGEPEFSYVFRPAPPVTSRPVPVTTLRPISVLAGQPAKKAS